MAQDSPNGSLLIQNASLPLGPGGAPQHNASVLVRDRRIQSVSSRGLAPPAGATVIDAGGRHLLPGFVDMHAHLISGGFDTITELGIIYERPMQRRVLAQMLYWGVTSVYSPVQPLENGLELRGGADAGTFPSPNLFISGPGFTAPGGWAGTNDPAARMEPQDDGQVERCLETLAEAGVDIVKVFYDDMSCAFVRPLPKLAKPMLHAIVRESHRHNLKVMVHAYDNQNQKEAMEAGADIMAHSAVTAPVDAQYVELARKNRLLYLATLSVYQDTFDEKSLRSWMAQDSVRGTVPASTLETLKEPGPLDAFERMIHQDYIRRQLPTIQANLKELWSAGVAIGVGPDTGVMGAFPGLAVHREMELMVQAGVPPAAVLTAATRTPAGYLGRKSLGTIEPGNPADLVLLRSDPLADIRNTREIDLVIRRGAVVDREKLLAGILQESSESRLPKDAKAVESKGAQL